MEELPGALFEHAGHSIGGREGSKANLDADELRPGGCRRFVPLVQPVRKGEARRVVVRVDTNRPEECFFIGGHLTPELRRF